SIEDTAIRCLYCGSSVEDLPGDTSTAAPSLGVTDMAAARSPAPGITVVVHSSSPRLATDVSGGSWAAGSAGSVKGRGPSLASLPRRTRLIGGLLAAIVIVGVVFFVKSGGSSSTTAPPSAPTARELAQDRLAQADLRN